MAGFHFRSGWIFVAALVGFLLAKHILNNHIIKQEQIDVIKALPDRSFQKYSMDEQQAFAPPPAALIAKKTAFLLSVIIRYS